MLEGWNGESRTAFDIKHKKRPQSATLSNSTTFLVHYGISLFGNPVALCIYI